MPFIRQLLRWLEYIAVLAALNFVVLRNIGGINDHKTLSLLLSTIIVFLLVVVTGSLIKYQVFTGEVSIYDLDSYLKKTPREYKIYALTVLFIVILLIRYLQLN